MDGNFSPTTRHAGIVANRLEKALPPSGRSRGPLQLKASRGLHAQIPEKDVEYLISKYERSSVCASELVTVSITVTHRYETTGSMLQLEPYKGSSRRLVIAIDVGTTYSGAAYCILDPGEIPKVLSVARYERIHWSLSIAIVRRD